MYMIGTKHTYNGNNSESVRYLKKTTPHCRLQNLPSIFKRVSVNTKCISYTTIYHTLFIHSNKSNHNLDLNNDIIIKIESNLDEKSLKLQLLNVIQI